ncbi:AbrB family transcriptional regulator [Paenibacillus sp. BR2-3]|uniref:AbrB family transcriptional regulator n=1 Tax=Paenibacillus sp. BR2-3 TaxID=3048494 RepID=UPI003977799D
MARKVQKHRDDYRWLYHRIIVIPSLIINAAQLMIGIYVGLLLNPGKLTHKLRTILLAIASSIVLIAGCLWWLDFIFSELFLFFSLSRLYLKLFLE